jgi:hypothetical protein
VSQRIKALKQRVNQVLVVRKRPASPTAAGVPFLRLAAQTVLLEAEALAEMGGAGGGGADRGGGQRRFDGDVVHRCWRLDSPIVGSIQTQSGQRPGSYAEVVNK